MAAMETGKYFPSIGYFFYFRFIRMLWDHVIKNFGCVV